MSSDNSSNSTNTDTNGLSSATSASRPKLTLNFNKSLPDDVAKRLEALKPKEKIVEASIKPKPQIQVQDQRRQKEQPQKAKPNNQNNNIIDITKTPNNSRTKAITSDTKIKANVASPVKADKTKVQTTLDTISNAQLASKKDKGITNEATTEGTDITIVNVTIKDKKQSTATSAVAIDKNYNAKVEAINVNTANTKDKSDNIEAQDKAESELKLASQNKKWLLKPQIYKKMIEEFRADFPNCFTIPKKPLALTIRTELIKAKLEYSKTEIGKFLQIYCGEKAYKQALVFNAERVNLKGEVSSLVTEEQLAKDHQNLKSRNEG